MRIRAAGPDDAPAIAGVHVRSWKAAYPGLVPQSFLDGLTPEDRLPMWHDALTKHAGTDPRTFVLVEDLDASSERIAGFTSFGPLHDASEGWLGEVMTLYVDPESWGRGGGAALLEAATEDLRRQGLRTATLWVLETNTRARTFYEHHGWQPDGATKLHDWTAFVATDVRYRREIG